MMLSRWWLLGYSVTQFQRYEFLSSDFFFLMTFLVTGGQVDRRTERQTEMHKSPLCMSTGGLKNYFFYSLHEECDKRKPSETSIPFSGYAPQATFHMLRPLELQEVACH